MSASKYSIVFLGTGGARFTVARQLLATGGAWLNLGGTQLLLDPGPGSLVYAIKHGCDPARLNGIILSHKHLDHSVDINVMIEAMTEGGWKRRGSLFAPADAFNDGAVVLPYVQGYPEKVELLEEGKEYSVGSVAFSTPVKHIHQVATYGFVFRVDGRKFSWITDTRVFDSLASHYAAELVIINVLSQERRLPVDHLAMSDATAIIREIRPRAAVLTHFGMPMWQTNPWELEEQMSRDAGVKVIAARDGMAFDIDSAVKY